MQPDFIVIGAMKCGSSTICAYLEDHPGVFMVPKAELNFFSHDENHAHGPTWYESFFAGQDGAQLRGEGSNAYASGQMFPHSAARMAAYKPDLKLIYVVRHPVERIVSAWIQNRVNMGDKIPPTLDRAVREMSDNYLGQSLYWQNLSRYRTLFPDDQIHIGFMEELKTDPNAFFAGLCAFLGVEPAPRIKRDHVNPSAGKTMPSAAYSAVNGLPLMGMLKSLLPRKLRHGVRNRFLTQRIAGDSRPDFSPAVRDWLRAELASDSAAFLAHCGKPGDYWRL